MDFLGHVISEDGISTDPKKTECVQNWPDPTTVKEVRSFLGFCSYYRRFIFRFSEIAKPLHKLTQKGVRFKWTKECQNAFQTLKTKLVNAPVLAHPDFNHGFILDVDACDQSIGAVISQKIHGEEHAIALPIWEELFGKDRSQFFKMAHELQKPRRTDCPLDRDIVIL